MIDTGVGSTRERELACALLWALKFVMFTEAEKDVALMYNRSGALARQVIQEDRQKELNDALARRQKANSPWG